MIFARDIDGNLTSLVKEIDKATAENKSKKMGSFVVFLSDDKELEAKLKDLAQKEGFKDVVLSIDNIAGGRFTDERKALLRSSRVGPTRLLSETLARLSKRPRVLVSASALGYYGDRGDAWVVEADPPANDFLGRLSVEWEQACDPARKAGIRVVNPRFGIILSTAGGALRTMLPPFRLER